MRVSIYPADQPDAGIILADASRLQALWKPSQMEVLVKDGLEGWFSSPQPRVELTDIPRMDGAFWPSSVPLSPRVLTIRGAHAIRGGASSYEVAQYRDRLAALVGKRLVVRVEDSAGLREVEGVLSDSAGLAVVQQSGLTEFTLIISCPDPIKYALPESFTGSNVAAINRGNYPVWPVFKVAGKCTRLTIDSPAGRVVWSGSATDLVLDSRFGIPTSGGFESGALTTDELFSLPPGETPIQMTVVGGGTPTVEVRSGWV